MTVLHLSGGAVSIVLDARPGTMPTVLHWGAHLGPVGQEQLDALAAAAVPASPPSSLDAPQRLGIIPLASDGWTGRPGLVLHRDGDAAAARAAAWPSVRVTDVAEHAEPGRGSGVRLTLADPAAGVRLLSDWLLDEHGVLSVRHELHNTGAGPCTVLGLAVTLPIDAAASELLDFAGRWAKERQPQRQQLREGVWSRENRSGRTGHDSPLVSVVGSAGFSFRAGSVWGTHLEWSGNQVQWAEVRSTGHRQVGAGELLASGEVVLAPGESFATPWVSAVHSDEGLDGLSRAFHGAVRSRRRVAGRALGPRPVVLNTWEAVYFDHDLAALRALAAAAHEVGVERFVLDDGWFLGRRDDTAGLGDWVVDPAVWPAGLHELVRSVQDFGMEFGLWVEPEMVNLDSDLVRAHPEWVLGGQGVPLPWRGQHVLNLAIPEAYAAIRDALVALLEEYPIRYIKWDHNRDLIEGGVHAQTLAVYRLLDELRARFPEVEFESCASGGARIDFGILARTDRVWASDTNDALERQAIQRFTGVLLPPELIGSHLGGPTAHTTGRTHRLSFRMTTALFAHAGIEWNIAAASPAERAQIAEWVATYKRFRGLLHGGVTVRADTAPAGDVWVHGVVAPDGDEALFAVVTLATAAAALREPVRFPGLHDASLYRVTRVPLGGEPLWIGDAAPQWWMPGTVTLPGSVLSRVGLPLPPLASEEGCVFHVERVRAAGE